MKFSNFFIERPVFAAVLRVAALEPEPRNSFAIAVLTRFPGPLYLCETIHCAFSR